MTIELTAPVADMTTEELKAQLEGIRKMRSTTYEPGKRKSGAKTKRAKTPEQILMEEIASKLDPEQLAKLLAEQ